MIGIVAGGGRTDKPLMKASRAKHKFAVKRNSWPKTRGVAMNPVDHPYVTIAFFHESHTNIVIVTEVVTTSISERHLPSRGTLCKVKRRVLLLREELVCSAVPRRSRIKRCFCSGVFTQFGYGWHGIRVFNGMEHSLGRIKTHKKSTDLARR